MQSYPDTLLSSASPDFSTDEAVLITSNHYGLEVSASPLYSYQDQNFRLRSNEGKQFVLKISNALERPEVIDFQTRALEHIALTDPGLPVPRTITDLNGEDYCTVEDKAGCRHMVRLISWLEGQIIDETQVGPDLLQQTGRILARLGLALKDFSHPAANHHLLWDLKNAAELRELLPHIEQRSLRELVNKSLGNFEQKVLPIIAGLRSQVIHSDLNCGNIVISETTPQAVSGVIDFGDMVHTPLIMDLAIASAYHLGETGDPLGQAVHFIDGYNQVLPIQAIEAEILFELMAARLCTSITVQMWRVKLYPENSEYLLMHNARARTTLKHFTSSATEKSRRRIMQICK